MDSLPSLHKLTHSLHTLRRKLIRNTARHQKGTRDPNTRKYQTRPNMSRSRWRLPYIIWVTYPQRIIRTRWAHARAPHGITRAAYPTRLVSTPDQHQLPAVHARKTRATCMPSVRTYVSYICCSTKTHECPYVHNCHSTYNNFMTIWII